MILLNITTIDFHDNSLKLAQVPIYQISDNQVELVLDSFICNEAQYEYFDDNVVLYINVMNNNGTTIQISSGHKGQYKPALDETYMDSTVGIIYYKKHTFLLYGRSVISSKIATRTEKTYLLEIIESDTSEIIEDDTYFPTSWICRYKKDGFHIMNKFEMFYDDAR